ncbi:bile acid:sodium symporter family protein [Nocardioides insulae]|uniref:bile acid:sodium symporter family protein n=1 Tax=Nocardioides insulae TaxID=394734 RepID=UPI00040F66DC|nr:bile acid:sodium symporter family protein [Nocardioides insulae]
MSTTQDRRAGPAATRTRARLVDPFTLALVATVLLASLWPASGGALDVLDLLSGLAVAALFFLNGVRLSPTAIWDGLRSWRTQGLILSVTFLLFPLLAIALSLALSGLLPRELILGLLFLSAVPSVVQTSTAFTSLAGGNVATSVCAAAVSNLVGVLVAPVLVALLTHSHGGLTLAAFGRIVVQVLVPFAIGQLLHRRWGAAAARNRRMLGVLDRGAILLIVYAAFGAAVTAGVWTRVAPVELILVTAGCGVLLASVLTLTTLSGRLWWVRPDEAPAVAFCGTQKSLTSGAPLASIVYGGATAGIVIIPLVIYHQLQLLVCGVLARRMALRTPGAQD